MESDRALLLSLDPHGIGVATQTDAFLPFWQSFGYFVLCVFTI